MSCLLKVVVLLSAVLSVYSVALEDCKCWENFEAKEDSDGKVQCHGTRTFELKPCNMPYPPRCVCTKEEVTGILTDKDGTWCSRSKDGNLVKKWDCENEEEWAAYKAKYAEFEKNRTE